MRGFEPVVDRIPVRGHQWGLSLTVQEDADWAMTITAEGPTRPSIEVEGPDDRAPAGITLKDLKQAIADSDGIEALRLSKHVSCVAEITLNNQPAAAGAHWVETTAALENLMNGRDWTASALQLASEPHVVVVEDAQDETLTTRGLVIAGPTAVVAPPAEVSDDLGYRMAVQTDERFRLLSPLLFAPPERPDVGGSKLRFLQQLLNGVARNLVWFWLASETPVIEDDGSLTITFSGARLVSVNLKAGHVQDVAAELRLYEWAAAGTDPARQEAVQRAISLAVINADDLPTAGGPALRTAKLLYELARRQDVAEAFATRRSAREVALTSARQAAQTARESAGRSVERALLQLGAAAAIVLSNAGGLISPGLAIGLLVLVAGLTIASWSVALTVEIPSAFDGLRAELYDLNQYRETLSRQDIRAIRKLRAVRCSTRDLGRARATIKFIYSAVIVAVLIGCVLVLTHGGSTKPVMPGPSPTSTVP